MLITYNVKIVKAIKYIYIYSYFNTRHHYLEFEVWRLSHSAITRFILSLRYIVSVVHCSIFVEDFLVHQCFTFSRLLTGTLHYYRITAVLNNIVFPGASLLTLTTLPSGSSMPSISLDNKYSVEQKS